MSPADPVPAGHGRGEESQRKLKATVLHLLWYLPEDGDIAYLKSPSLTPLVRRQLTYRKVVLTLSHVLEQDIKFVVSSLALHHQSSPAGSREPEDLIPGHGVRTSA